MMDTPSRSRQSTRALLCEAAALLPDSVAHYQQFMDHNEFELAADELVHAADKLDMSPPEFWRACGQAFVNLGFRKKAGFCDLRAYEAEFGFIEVRLTLLSNQEGGRSAPVLPGFRPDWNVDVDPSVDSLELGEAPITLEGSPSVAPGQSVMVRLHPSDRRGWAEVEVGLTLDMYEGENRIGHGEVTRVTLQTF